MKTSSRMPMLLRWLSALLGAGFLFLGVTLAGELVQGGWSWRGGITTFILLSVGVELLLGALTARWPVSVLFFIPW